MQSHCIQTNEILIEFHYCECNTIAVQPKWALGRSKLTKCILMFFTGVADADNWHGKPLGNQAQEAIKAIKDNIINSGQHNIIPRQPTLTLSPVSTSVQLSQPPSYKLGETVSLLCIF